jgi:hypothetical protein
MARSVAILLALVGASLQTLGGPLCCIAHASCCANARVEEEAEAARSCCARCEPEAPVPAPQPQPESVPQKQKKECDCEHAHPPLSVTEKAVDLQPVAVVSIVELEPELQPSERVILVESRHAPPPGGGHLTLPLLL